MECVAPFLTLVSVTIAADSNRQLSHDPSKAEEEGRNNNRHPEERHGLLAGPSEAIDRDMTEETLITGKTLIAGSEGRGGRSQEVRKQ